MRLSQIKFLVELNKYGTISKTAQKLYISQPSLSTAIKELEEELGFDIIERSNRGVGFTKRGAIVLEHCQTAMQAINGIERMGKTGEKLRKGYLSVATVPYIFETLVMDAFLELKQRYPDTTASLREMNSYDMVELLASREIDLGIVMISNLEELTFQQAFEKYNLQFYKLFDDQMYFIVGRQNPLFGCEVATISELVQYPFVTRSTLLNQFNRNVMMQYNKDMEFIQIDDSRGLVKYIMNSQAVSMMPSCSFWKSSYHLCEDLHAVRIQDLEWTTKLGWIFPRDEQYSIELEEFVELIEERYSNMPKI